MRQPLEHCRLYTFIDTAYLGARSPAELARQLCDGGSDLIQLRAKGADPDEVFRLAAQIQPVLQQAGVGLVINDHWEIARKIGADFCHLGQEDYFSGEVGQGLQPRPAHGPWLGLSTHAREQAARALAEHPAYIAIGPVYATPTKPGVPAVTLDYVRWAAANVRIPWFAIGGINLGNVRDVIDAGASRICVVSAILNAAEPATACREFRRLLST
jgi:thiamine-phosphate pyrophosphorylase